MSNFTLPTQRAKKLADNLAKRYNLSEQQRDEIFNLALIELNGEIADVASGIRDRLASYVRTRNIHAAQAFDEFVNFLSNQLGTIEGKKVKPGKKKDNTKSD